MPQPNFIADTKQLHPQPILLFGMPQGAVSFAAALLKLSGAWVGNAHGVNAAHVPQDEHYENLPIRDGVHTISLVNSWFGDTRCFSTLSSFPFDAARLGMCWAPSQEFFTGTITKLIYDQGYRGEMSPVWMVKDYRLPLAPLRTTWNVAFPNAYWIHIRYTLGTLVERLANSYLNQYVPEEHRGSPQFWEQVVNAYYKEVNVVASSVPNFIEVNGNALEKDPEDELRPVIEAIKDTQLEWYGFVDEEQDVKDAFPFKWNDIAVMKFLKQRSKAEEQERLSPKATRRFTTKGMRMNNPAFYILRNIGQNIKRQLPQAQAYPLQKDVRIAILCGGPSLEQHKEEVQQKYKDGVKLVATNGTHDWCLDNGMSPSAMVMVDSREFNERFVRRAIKDCKYLIASQCHSSVFDVLNSSKAAKNVYIWHALAGVGEQLVLDEYYLGNYSFVPGGSTVGLRAIALMRMLGFQDMDIYGMDSCYMDDKHHSYSQKENDTTEVKNVYCFGKMFRCTSWMASQADEFQELVANLGGAFRLDVHGEGLIKHIMREAVKIQDEFELELEEEEGKKRPVALGEIKSM